MEDYKITYSPYGFGCITPAQLVRSPDGFSCIAGGCLTCSPYGGWIYLTDGTKILAERNEKALVEMTPEERDRALSQFEDDQKHLAELFPKHIAKILRTKGKG
jgi:hypothetical protein